MKDYEEVRILDKKLIEEGITAVPGKDFMYKGRRLYAMGWDGNILVCREFFC
jgi:hypothetical protein